MPISAASTISGRSSVPSAAPRTRSAITGRCAKKSTRGSRPGAVVVASSYTKVGGVYDFGFRHDPDNPLESLADYCMGCYTNRNLPQRVDMLANYIEEYEADGLLINSIKSCNSFSAGQLLIMREVEKRTGKPAAFIETDLVDPRYFSPANVKNRLESYFQMIDQKRQGGAVKGEAA